MICKAITNPYHNNKYKLYYIKMIVCIFSLFLNMIALIKSILWLHYNYNRMLSSYTSRITCGLMIKFYRVKVKKNNNNQCHRHQPMLIFHSSPMQLFLISSLYKIIHLYSEFTHNLAKQRNTRALYLNEFLPGGTCFLPCLWLYHSSLILFSTPSYVMFDQEFIP